MPTNLNYNESKSKYKSESLKNASQNNLKHVQNNLVNTKIVLVSIPCLNTYSRKRVSQFTCYTVYNLVFKLCTDATQNQTLKNQDSRIIYIVFAHKYHYI